MAKVTCNCGSIIHDVSDDLPYKAHLLADQDFFDFFDEVKIGKESERFDRLIEYLYDIYQCENCHALILFRDNKRYDFEMVETFNKKQSILHKYHEPIPWKSSNNYEIIDPYNYFNDKLMQMEHESKGWLSGLSVNILGRKFVLTFYTVHRFAQDIESDLESKSMVMYDEDFSNILFVNLITPEHIKRAVEEFVRRQKDVSIGVR